MDRNNSVTESKPTKYHLAINVVIKPIVDLCLRFNVDPNVFTWCSVLFTVLASFFAVIGYWGWAIIMLILSALCDVIDGAIDRKMPSRPKHLKKRGAFLDPAVDRINDGIIFVGLLLYSLSTVLEQAYNSDAGIWIVSTFSAVWHIFFYIIFFALLMSAAIAHQISSFYRARIESLGVRWKEDKNVARAGFITTIGFVFLGMLVLPKEYEWRYFIVSVSILVCLPIIIKLIGRFRHALRLFDEAV